MVGVGIDGQESSLARVCIVNSFGNVVYDKFVRANSKDPIVDYRTKWSGVRPADLKSSKGMLKMTQQNILVIR